MRKPFQGTWNIIRFNWHLYLLSMALLLFLFLLTGLLNPAIDLYIQSLFWFITSSTILSLLVSFYVYDVSALYKLGWLSGFDGKEKKVIVNIHAGFDETSALLKERYPEANLAVLDFYDPLKHTEIAIKRARKAYPPFAETEKVETTKLPLEDHVADIIFVFFSAHEIRSGEERIAFFSELNRIMKPAGKAVVTEHLRDTANFLAYNIGFFHFFSKPLWLKTFQASNLQVQKELKITPFVSSFLLIKNGATS